MKGNEINKIYRSTDSDKYANNPLIIGKEIKLSSTTKPKARCELCKELTGSYPTWFKWTGWHDECICFMVPLLMSDELMAKYQLLVARGEDTPEAIKILQTGHRIDTLPNNFKDWVNETIQNQQDFENAPYFITENFEDFKDLQLHTNN